MTHGFVRPVEQSFGPAHYVDDTKKFLTYASHKYPEVELRFTLHDNCLRSGKRNCYRCVRCYNLGIKLHLRTVGLRFVMLPVLNDELVDKDPDAVGTNFGHICQNPGKLAELVALLPPELRRADGTRNDRRSGPRPINRSFGPANFRDASKKRFSYESRRYSGVTFDFYLHGAWLGDARRNPYHCVDCYRYLVRMKMHGVKTATVCVLNGEIVDKDPDDAGTDQGHLCQELEKFGLEQSEASVGRRQSGAREVTKSFGLAGFVDGERKRLAYESRRYEGVTHTFVLNGAVNVAARRSCYFCLRCHKFFRKLKPAGVKMVMLVVLNGEIVDKDPDDVGTNHGHLCQQPEKVAELSAELGIAISDHTQRSGPRPSRASFGPARFLTAGKTHVLYESRLYPGAMLRFYGPIGCSSGSRKLFYRCSPCSSIYDKLKAVDEKLAMLIVLDGVIIDRDPDDAGTNFGHLCQQPEKVAQLEKRLSRRGSAGTFGSRKRKHPSNSCVDANGSMGDRKRSRTTTKLRSVAEAETMSLEDVDDSFYPHLDRSSSTLSDIYDLDVVHPSSCDLETTPDVMSTEAAIASFAAFDDALYIDLDLTDESDAALDD